MYFKHMQYKYILYPKCRGEPGIQVGEKKIHNDVKLASFVSTQRMG